MSFFGGGGGDDDEYAYDYQSSNRNKKASGKSSGSPQYTSAKPVPVKQNNVVIVDSSNALDRAKSMLSKYSSKPAEPVAKLQKSTKSFNEDDISIDSEDFSDMDMSESDDFKHKAKDTKSKGDTKSKKKNINDLGAPEAIVTVSMGDNEEESDVDFDDAAREFLNRSNLSDSAQKGDFEEDSEHDNYSNDDFDIDDKPVSRAASKSVSKPVYKPVEKSAAAVAARKYNVDLSESDAFEIEQSNNDDFEVEQSNNDDFEVEQSNNHATSNDDFEVEESHGGDDVSVDAADDEDNNASYSRMVYGNGDDEEDDDDEAEEVHSSDREVDDEVDDEMEVSNKPIILSFADLAAIPSWEQTSYGNGDLTVGQSEIEESVAEVEESEILEAPSVKPTVTASKSATTKSRPSDSEDEEEDSYGDDDYVDEFEESRAEVAAPPTAATVVKSAAAPAVKPSASVEVKKDVMPATVPPPIAATVVKPSVAAPAASTANPAPVAVAPPVAAAAAPVAPPSTAPPAAASAAAPVAAPSTAPTAPSAYPPYPYPPPPYYGYPYGPPPGAAPVPGYPPSDPQQHHHQPPPPHPYHPYGAAAPPPPPAYPFYPPMPYGMYPHMMAPPPPPSPYYDPRASLLGLGGGGGSSLYGAQNPFSPFPYPQTGLNASPFAANNPSSAQPLVLDLLQELRKTKEEAEWAKQKLAETMLFVRDQEASTERLRKSESALHTAPTVSSVSAASGSGKVSSPKSSKTPASVAARSAPPAAASSAPTAAAAAARSKSRYAELDRSVSESMDEVNESEILDDPSEVNDYSDDFDQESHLNLSTYSAAGGVHHKASPQKKHVTLANIPEEPEPYRRAAAPATAPSAASGLSQRVSYEPPAWRMEQRPAFGLPTTTAARESVVDPLKQSLAHSLLSSQELFKNQIESLRLRLSMANLPSTTVERRWEATRSSLPATYPTTFKPAASLAELKQEFAKKRIDDTRKLYEVLTQVYPDLEESEAVYIAEKF